LATLPEETTQRGGTIMSDRCYAVVTCHVRDLEVFTDIGYNDESSDSSTNDVVSLRDPEANYGHCQELSELRDIPFLHSHSAGGDYPACVAAHDGRNFVEVQANDNGDPVVTVHEDGTPDQEEIENVRKYYLVKANALKALKERGNKTD
jgi:hypothetical protein